MILIEIIFIYYLYYSNFYSYLEVDLIGIYKQILILKI